VTYDLPELPMDTLYEHYRDKLPPGFVMIKPYQSSDEELEDEINPLTGKKKRMKKKKTLNDI
jgi:hypothetical protein